MTLLAVVAGVALIVAVAVDVWLTLLHPDAEGPIARTVRRLVWRASSLTAGRRRTPRRTPLVWAGPILVTGTFLAWLGPLVLGVALVVWPHLDGYHRIAGFGPAGFLDAVYYATGLLTVLGFGDITPDTGAQKLFAVTVAALGFAFFAALATYLIELITGLTVRNRFALTIHDQVRGTDGVGLIARSLTDEGVDVTRQRCAAWAESLREVDDTVRRYPLVALTYRPRRRDYDIEPALEQMAVATIAALLAARCDAWRGLGPRAEELAYALLRLQDTIASRYLGRHLLPASSEPAAGAGDTTADEVLRRLRDRLTEDLGTAFDRPPGGDGLAGEVLSRSLPFLAALRGWSVLGVTHDGRPIGIARPDEPR
ncbi:two pore domain potassium channel family protein [Micromonospora sp. Llam7]|uniref:potassium channel family protein n=1 Tax=Micromonospora tarapacensis TaxID=2835305 RepID=UPI001C831719|nr:potassium channel family protein [Micromonospora tarapacensis]MBX7268084.1 two pore domain potassium channel family protein [Micromonospora tarapacensis]